MKDGRKDKCEKGRKKERGREAVREGDRRKRIKDDRDVRELAKVTRKKRREERKSERRRREERHIPEFCACVGVGGVGAVQSKP